MNMSRETIDIKFELIFCFFLFIQFFIKNCVNTNFVFLFLLVYFVGSFLFDWCFGVKIYSEIYNETDFLHFMHMLPK